MVCPEYRLRLFLSVDLVGSTAYKSRFGEPDPEKSPNPAWVDQIRHFYRECPETLFRNFQRAVQATGESNYAPGPPQVWKTIGDEIVFCCRLRDLQHLSFCMTAFVQMLSDYGEHLDGVGKHLDVKAYGWVAAFPSPNVTIEVYTRKDASDPTATSDIPDEYVEVSADKTPKDFDFLGKGIDSGFRSGRYCSADSLMLSIELAYLTAMAVQERLLHRIEFAYAGRQSLKGVINDRPYPLISIDAERNNSRRLVREREETVLGHNHRPTATHIVDFMEAFMTDEGIEKPVLPVPGKSAEQEFPKTYRDFIVNWRAASQEISMRSASEAEAELRAEGTVENLPIEVTDALTDVAGKVGVGTQRSGASPEAADQADS